jgi:hypothetical protein
VGPNLTTSVEDVAVRTELLPMRRCKRCGSEHPGHLDRCRLCPAILGDVYSREVAFLGPAQARGGLADRVLPAVVLAVEFSAEAHHRQRLIAQGRRWIDALLRALAPQPLVSPMSDGVFTLLLASEPPAQAAGHAARAVTTLEAADDVEWRAGLATGLVDGAAFTSAAVLTGAARLARAAQPGQVLASLSASRLLERDWQFAPVGVFPRRADSPADGAVALVGRKPPAPTPSALTGDGAQELVGRERELAILDEEWALAQAGETRWCVITAPAGAGKSALIRTWLHRHQHVAGRVIGAAGSPFGQAPRAVVDQLLSASGAGVDADATPADVLCALDKVWRGAARADPLLIVIDDLHWADADSLTLLASLSAWVWHGVLFLVSLRRSFVPQVSWLWDRGRPVELAPLSGDARRDLIARLLPGPDAAPIRRALTEARQGGNPLYLEQAAAYLQETGNAAPPHSLHAAILARLDVLRRRIDRVGYERPSAAELATIERTAGEWLDRLETGDYDDRATIAQYLSMLERIDAALVIAASIAGVPLRRNRRLAAAVERFYATAFAERAEAIEHLAHYDSANAAAAACRGVQRARAAVRLVDASRFLTLAARLCDGEQRARCLIELGDIELARGDPNAAAKAYVEARACPGGERWHMRCDRRLARARLAQGDPPAARELLARVVGKLPPAEGFIAACDLAYVRGVLGDRRRAWMMCDHLEQTREPASLHALLGRVRLRLALLDGGMSAQTALSRRCASLLVLENDPVGDLASVLDTVLLLRAATPARVDERLTDEARSAARRLGNRAAEARLDGGEPAGGWQPIHPSV